MLYIFDLDHTTIDSSHRSHTLEGGALNLAAWRENSTPEMIARDSLLPLGEQWRDMVARGLDGTNVQIAIITARVMGAADLQYLDDNGLAYDYLYSRTEGDTSNDAALKKIMLFDLARDMGRSITWLQNFAWFYDDNLGVIEMGCSLGINMVNSTFYNQKAV
tara:strand:+ start:114 stop:599 length:486 start_codon:yes stop_codon:yes gene_type:complete